MTLHWCPFAIIQYYHMEHFLIGLDISQEASWYGQNTFINTGKHNGYSFCRNQIKIKWILAWKIFFCEYFFRKYGTNYSLFRRNPLDKPMPRIYSIGHWLCLLTLMVLPQGDIFAIVDWWCVIICNCFSDIRQQTMTLICSPSPPSIECNDILSWSPPLAYHVKFVQKFREYPTSL